MPVGKEIAFYKITSATHKLLSKCKNAHDLVKYLLVKLLTSKNFWAGNGVTDLTSSHGS